jgi:hypothetical protein
MPPLRETQQSWQAPTSLPHPWESGTLSGSRRECCNHAKAAARQATAALDVRAVACKCEGWRMESRT